ncbi:MAG TPA: YggS family pyridoxal phosphate-dependent enzyme [Burkholderiales bacterium]
MTGIAHNLQALGKRLERVRGVTLLAVSKGQSVERIQEAVAAGQKAFGENYVQEALAKMQALPGLEWHLIGPLQSNKTRAAAEHFAWVQTIDREKIARRLSEQRPKGLPPLNVLIQVNVSAESSKSGVAPEGALALAEAVGQMPRLRLRGLMAIPEPGALRERYRTVKSLFDQLREKYAFDTLSMGMSDDMDLAIAEGATMVRVGTAIFGARQKAKSAAMTEPESEP